MKVNISIWADGVEVRPNTAGDLLVDLEAVELADLVGEIGVDKLLDEIGEDEAVEYFRLELKE